MAIVLITGTSTGIGFATAVACARARHEVYATMRDPVRAPQLQTLARQEGLPVSVLPLDVDNDASVSGAIEHLLAERGRIDVLVNNAGVTRRAYIMDLNEADWDRIMRVNGKGVFFCLQRVAREMIPRRSGVIINIASIAGKGFAGTSNAIYAGSKGAVIGMTRIAALQLARHNINVNAICPGSTVTALSNDNLRTRAKEEGVSVEEMERRRNAGIPLGRANDPEDIAAMAVFLASPGARNITGQSFNVDGGVILD
jgi:NAD(P)-dependent dehydrogenase (short-subunit alcohol dehydrogenase family)